MPVLRSCLPGPGTSSRHSWRDGFAPDRALTSSQDTDVVSIGDNLLRTNSLFSETTEKFLAKVNQVSMTALVITMLCNRTLVRSKAERCRVRALIFIKTKVDFHRGFCHRLALMIVLGRL